MATICPTPPRANQAPVTCGTSPRAGRGVRAGPRQPHLPPHLPAPPMGGLLRLLGWPPQTLPRSPPQRARGHPLCSTRRQTALVTLRGQIVSFIPPTPLPRPPGPGAGGQLSDGLITPALPWGVATDQHRPGGPSSTRALSLTHLTPLGLPAAAPHPPSGPRQRGCLRKPSPSLQTSPPMPTHPQACTHMPTRIHMHQHPCPYMHTHAPAHRYSHTCTHTHLHTDILSWRESHVRMVTGPLGWGPPEGWRWGPREEGRLLEPWA